MLNVILNHDESWPLGIVLLQWVGFAPGHDRTHKTNPKQMCILHLAFAFGKIHQSNPPLLQLDDSSSLRQYLKNKRSDEFSHSIEG